MAGNYAQLLDIINNPTQHGLPAWDNNAKEIEGETIQQYLLSIINSLTVGYQFMGVATPSTSPGTPDQNVFYIGGAGTYANFGTSITVRQGQICVFKWNGSWINTPIEIANSGFVNVNDINGRASAYESASAGRSAVSTAYRKSGLNITYLLSTGENTSQWVHDMFIGNDITDWNVADNWKVVGPVSVSQNMETGHTEIHIGDNDYPVASVEEVSQLGQNVDDIKTKIGNVEISWEKGTYYQSSSESPGYEKVLTPLNYETAVVDMSGRDGNSFRAYLSTGSGVARVFVLDTNGNKLLVYSSVNNLIDFVLPSNVGQVLLTNRYLDVLFPKVFVSDTTIPSVATMEELFAVEQRLNPILNNLKGAKVSFIGDSITQGYYASEASKRYCNVFCSKYGAVVNNLGVASTSIANNTLDERSDSRFVTRATAENLAGSKLIVVFGGTNDFTYDSKAIGDLFRIEPITPDGYVGNKAKLAVMDTDTFAGALHELINTIRTNCPNVPIVFMTPLKRGYLSGNPKRPQSYQANQWGNYLDDFCNAIKEIGAYYAIPVLDLNGNSELDFVNASIAGDCSQDNLHPNDKGHAIIAELLFRFVEKNVVIM